MGEQRSRSIVSYFIGVDVGGTTSTIAIGDQDRRLLAISAQFATRSVDGPDATIEDIATAVIQGVAALGGTVEEISHIGLATPGPATLDGVLLTTPNLRADLWDQCPIREKLQLRLAATCPRLRVSYIGDGQAAALGEFAIRSGQIDAAVCDTFSQDHRVAARADLQSLFFVAVGTGLGGGEVRDGKVVRGSAGRAGHAGHLLLPGDAFRYEHDRKKKVGNAYSSAESAISLSALTHQLEYRLTLPQWKDHPLQRHVGSMKDKACQLRVLGSAGDPLAIELLDDQARALGIVMLMVNYLGDYDMLVVGGGVCDMTDALRTRYLEIAEKSYFDHALNGFRNFSGLAFSICGDQASVLGALRHAYQPLELG